MEPLQNIEIDPKLNVSDHESDNELCYDGYEESDLENDQLTQLTESDCQCQSCSMEFSDVVGSDSCCKCNKIIELLGESGCITETQKFRALVLDKDILLYSRYLFAMAIRDKQEKEAYLRRDMDNTMLRHLAYKSFIAMMLCRHLGRHKRIELPNCVVSTIRKIFPDSNGT